MNEQDLLQRIQTAWQGILSSKLTGIYVHGSIAFGCFRWESSDIDFLAVVETRLHKLKKKRLFACCWNWTLLRLPKVLK